MSSSRALTGAVDSCFVFQRPQSARAVRTSAATAVSGVCRAQKDKGGRRRCVSQDTHPFPLRWPSSASCIRGSRVKSRRKRPVPAVVRPAESIGKRAKTATTDLPAAINRPPGRRTGRRRPPPTPPPLLRFHTARHSRGKWLVMKKRRNRTGGCCRAPTPARQPVDETAPGSGRAPSPDPSRVFFFLFCFLFHISLRTEAEPRLGPRPAGKVVDVDDIRHPVLMSEILITTATGPHH